MAKQEKPNRGKKVESEFDNKVISVRRVNKTVKGGRDLSFSAFVVVGNRKGKVGLGSGKDSEVPNAIEKAVSDAKKHLFTVPIVGTTIPHEVLAKFGTSSVILLPASEGTGIIAGGASRVIVEMSGIKDIVAKMYGSRTSMNSARATIDGLKSLRTREQIAMLRGKNVEEI